MNSVGGVQFVGERGGGHIPQLGGMDSDGGIGQRQDRRGGLRYPPRPAQRLRGEPRLRAQRMADVGQKAGGAPRESPLAAWRSSATTEC
jgi:hypothetical protein